MYRYEFVEIPIARGFKAHSGDTIEECKKAIAEKAAEGWRFVQMVMPQSEKAGMFLPLCYELIFEKESSPDGRQGAKYE